MNVELKTTSSVDLIAKLIAGKANVVDHSAGCPLDCWEHRLNFKNIGAELDRRDADPAAAHLLVTAFNQGKVDPWLAAYLLGCIGDPSGYETVRQILLSAPRFLAESYAGEALAKIRGLEALPDLANLVYEAPRRISREGAAWGLGSLGSVDAASIVFDAAVWNLIRVSQAGHILASLPINHSRVAHLFSSGQERLVRLGIAIVLGMKVSKPESKAIGHPLTKSQDTLLLLSAIQRVLKDPVVKMAPRTREALTDWASKTEALHAPAT